MSVLSQFVIHFCPKKNWMENLSYRLNEFYRFALFFDCLSEEKRRVGEKKNYDEVLNNIKHIQWWTVCGLIALR